MRKNIVFFLFFIIIQQVYSQNNNQLYGKITYSISTQNANRNIEMWFTPEKYMYTSYVNYDVTKSRTFTNKKYNSIEDSLNDLQKQHETNAQLKELKKQYWYGEARSNVVVFSYFNYNDNSNGYCVTDTLQQIQWELTNDTLTINGLYCQKALGILSNIKFVAWFAPSIPVSVAPYNYQGLPGLLIQLTNSKNSQVLSMVELDWPAKESSIVKIEPCSRYPLITRKEMNRISDNANKKAYETLESIKSGKKVNIVDLKN